MRFRWICLLVFVWCGLAVTDVRSHPFHVSLAEIDWNDESRKLEVAMQVHAVDLEAALGRFRKQRLRLEDAAAEGAARDYTFKAFQVGARNSVAVLKWVGWEVDDRTAWLYFEVPLSDFPDEMVLTNRMLFHVPGQVNTVVVRSGAQRGSLTLTAEEPMGVIRLSKP